jgi:beta-galactosidase/beta-glucuronidase
MTNDLRPAHTGETDPEPLNPLPRTVLRPNATVLLDGEWRFDLDLDDCGLAEQWYDAHAYRNTANWPGSIESHMAAAQTLQHQPPARADAVVAWYERDFELPAGWRDDPRCLVQLTFGACGYETRVWLNGRPLQTIEGEAVHVGEYTSFSYELPPELLQHTNRLTVRIADSLDAELPRGKQESHVYKRGGIWYQAISGSVRSVWLEQVERNRLRSRLAVISTIEDRLVEFNFTTRIHDPGPYTLRVRVNQPSGELLAARDFPLRLREGEQRQRVVLALPNAPLWSPDNPALLELTAGLLGVGGETAQIQASFGLRKIEARGRAIYLNNQPLYLNGILYQPANATFEQMRRHMVAMKELGCNLVRIHIAGIDPRIYGLADELGVLLWVEVPSPHSSTRRSRANHWAELQRMLVFVGAHPSVAIWSLYNEDWGAEDIAHNAETRAYIASTYGFMRVHYPNVLVVDNDGWHHVSTEGRLESHLLTAHLYTPNLERWQTVLDQLASGQTEGVAARPLVVGDPFFYAGQVPLLVSEWGGFGFADYGGPEETAAKANRIRAFKRELRKRPFAGDVYTQATSIEDENNGVIDPQTGVLLAPPGILRSPDEPADPEEPQHA